MLTVAAIEDVTYVLLKWGFGVVFVAALVLAVLLVARYLEGRR